MTQDTIVLLVFLAAVGWAVFRTARTICRKNKADTVCGSCPMQCGLKEKKRKRKVCEDEK